MSDDNFIEEIANEVSQKINSKKSYAQIEEEKKKEANYLDDLITLKELKILNTIINNRIKQRENASDEEKVSAAQKYNEREEFNEEIGKYYQEKQKASEKEIANFRTMSEEQKMQTALITAIKKIDENISHIKASQGWSFWKQGDEKEVSWNVGLKAQAEHFAGKEKVKDEVTQLQNKYVAKANAKANTTLSLDEQKLIASAQKEAFDQFKDSLSKISPEQIDTPSGKHAIQQAYSLLAIRLQIELDASIKEINRQRQERNKTESDSTKHEKLLERVKISVTDIVNFADKNPVVNNDRNEIMNNMHNYFIFEQLQNQKKVLQATYEKSNGLTPAQANKSGYDSDRKERKSFAVEPQKTTEATSKNQETTTPDEPKVSTAPRNIPKRF